MSNIWKITIAITLVLCLAVAFIACGNDDEYGELYITDTEGQNIRVEYVTNEEGETILDENGNPITEIVGETVEFTLPVEEDEGGEIYGPLIKPSNKK